MKLKAGYYFWCAMRMGVFVGAGMSVMAVLAVGQERPTREGYMFSYADASRDGSLSPGEFMTVLYPGTTGRFAGDDVPQPAAAAFSGADLDGNGRIDLAEFSRWLANRN